MNCDSCGVRSPFVQRVKEDWYECPRCQRLSGNEAPKGAVDAIRDAIARAQGEETRPLVNQDYAKRCLNWQARYDAAIDTARRCKRAGIRNYEVETMGYIAWLLAKRPFRGDGTRDYWQKSQYDGLVCQRCEAGEIIEGVCVECGTQAVVASSPFNMVEL